MKAYGYVRVSTISQAESGLGLDAQRSVIEAHCATQGWELVEIVEDQASGAKADREGLSKVLTSVESCRGALVCARTDRLTRSLAHFAKILAQSAADGWRLVLLDLQVDTGTPQGRFAAQIMAAVAELEREMIAQRTRVALAERKAKGLPMGRPRQIPPEIRSRIIRMAGRKLGPYQIARRLNEEGVPTARGGPWAGATVQRVLRAR